MDKSARLNSLLDIQSNYEGCTDAVRRIMTQKERDPTVVVVVARPRRGRDQRGAALRSGRRGGARRAAAVRDRQQPGRRGRVDRLLEEERAPDARASSRWTFARTTCLGRRGRASRPPGAGGRAGARPSPNRADPEPTAQTQLSSHAGARRTPFPRPPRTRCIWWPEENELWPDMADPSRVRQDGRARAFAAGLRARRARAARGRRRRRGPAGGEASVASRTGTARPS